MSRALQRQLQRCQASRDAVAEAHQIALADNKRLKQTLKAIAAFGEDYRDPCILCGPEPGWDRKGHLDTCPFHWAAEAVRRK